MSETTTGAKPHEAVVRGSATGFAQEITAGGHSLVADEPVALGGTNTGPNPYDLLLSALGACTSMTISLYARRKAWPLESVTVRLRHAKIHAEDCAECETKEGQIDRIERRDLEKRKVFVGRMHMPDGDAVEFVAVGTTGELVKRSTSKFCGVVIGRANDAAKLVGMFDLPENATPLVEQ